MLKWDFFLSPAKLGRAVRKKRTKTMKQTPLSLCSSRFSIDENMEKWIEIDIGNVRYLCMPTVKIHDERAAGRISPVMVLPVDDEAGSIKEAWVRSLLSVVCEDDVSSRHFLSRVYFAAERLEHVTIEVSAVTLLEEYESHADYLVTKHNVEKLPSPGPHLLYKSWLWQASRLYDDTFGAFQIPLEPQIGSGSSGESFVFKKLGLAGQGIQTFPVAVPSRFASLSLASSNRTPLLGKRFAVKDVFRMKGLKTSLCNSAYLQVNESAEETAPIVKMFIDCGAHVLGMTKLSSLISREEPLESVDFQTPFNPRGDGYQSPAGSSSGSAASVASYPWVDFSIGTDTSGSGRRPALANGVFQLCPTHSDMNLEGMVPTFPPWDTPVFFTRSITMLQHIAEFLCFPGSSGRRVEAKEKQSLIFPLDYFPVENSVQMETIKSFMKDFEEHLGIQTTEISIESEWSNFPPIEANGQTVREFLKDAAVDGYYFDFYHSYDGFRQAYHEKFQKRPYVTPFNRWRWGLGQEVSLGHHQESMRRLSVYRRWFFERIMKKDKQNSFLLLPVQNVEPNYRDIAPPAPVPQEGFDQLLLPAILGSPDVFVPLGECGYLSQVSGVQEHLPVGVDIVGNPGQDWELVKSVRGCLESSKRPLEVNVGSRMFGDFGNETV